MLPGPSLPGILLMLQLHPLIAGQASGASKRQSLSKGMQALLLQAQSILDIGQAE